VVFKVERTIGGRLLSIETGLVAKQANGAVLVRYADTVILATVVAAELKEPRGFFPLTVDYREKTYAAGKFPGGFYKREGRPTQKEILTMRLIDRPIRPLFPDHYQAEVQVMAMVLSADQENDPDILAMVGTSAALAVSDVPFAEVLGCVRIGRLDGQFVINPTHQQLEESELELVVSGTGEAVAMVEGNGKEVPDDVVVEAIAVAHQELKPIVEMIQELVTQCGKPKKEIPSAPDRTELHDKIRSTYAGSIREAALVAAKAARAEKIREVFGTIVKELTDGQTDTDAYTEADIISACKHVEKELVRSSILEEGRRTDGRKAEDIRQIDCQIALLPRTHGSALFTRGETQALVATTLGTTYDAQRVDGLREEYAKSFMLDYNFPPFCVGEARMIRGPGRREIGHGALAEKSLKAVIPSSDVFPYTIRLVSDIMESNGSSSMATVCGATLALMDAGVPIKHPVAGLAMGLVKEGERSVILTDILGTEDFLGDMDFKVAGTQNGITGLQMDIKVKGIDQDLLRQAILRAREARMEILRQMLQTIAEPRKELSSYAPRLVQIQIPVDKIGTLIGPGGRMIRGLQEETKTSIEIDDSGLVTVSGDDAKGVEEARSRIEGITAEAEVGKIYKGTVTGIKDFGAFVEFLPGQEGLLHISELSNDFVENVRSVVKMGDEIEVKVIEVDSDTKRIRLSHKAVMREREEQK